MHTFLAVGLIGSLVAASVAVAAQDAGSSVARAPVTEYFDEDNQRLPSAEGADHRTETTYLDSIRGFVRTFSLPTGQLRDETHYSHIRRRIRHGIRSYYYESGQLHWQTPYVAGNWEGDFVTYYPSGVLKRRDRHVTGQPFSGECFGPDGQPVPYYKFEVMPVYPEGAGDTKAVANAIMLNTRYPWEALRRRFEATIEIRFVVDANGKVQRARPVKEPKSAPLPAKLTAAYQALEEEAMAAVRALRPFTPGRQDGEPVPVSFSIPVDFRIKK